MGAERHNRTIVTIKPRPGAAHAGASSTESLVSAAVAAFSSGDLENAGELAKKAYAAGDHSPECLQILGTFFSQKGEHEIAVEAFNELSDLLAIPFAAALHALGNEYRSLGQLDDALAAYQRASALCPDDGPLAHQLANVLHAKGQLGPARVHYERARRLLPESPEIAKDLGAALAAQREFALALSQFEAAAARLPKDPGTAFNCAQALFSLGDTDRSFALFQKAEQLGHGPDALTMQAVIAPGCHELTEEGLLQTRRRYSAERLPPLARPMRPREVEPDPAGRLRIGYVSAFFPDRNWMKPMWGAINNHDRKRFQIHLFSDSQLKEPPPGYEPGPGDVVHIVKGLDNRALAECIRREKIDILVDLNGYSCVPRLGLYPLRAAPVQFAWAGMYATSGQDSFDALMTDGVVVPEGEERFYSEPIRRLPGTHLAFDVRYPVPPIAPAPSRDSGRVTFGCLGPLYKLHPITLRAFAEILKRTPESRLLLRNRGFDLAGNRARVQKSFEGLGISSERLLLLGGAEHFAFLETYNQIDIALDTFPYNGGTTTMEALWQGVPLLTYRGRRLIERQSTTLILAAGLAEHVAPDIDGFIDLACRMAAEARTEEFSDRRMSARERVAGSMACNTPLLSRSMQGIYEEVYQARCLAS